jgi:hypothetical protein
MRNRSIWVRCGAALLLASSLFVPLTVGGSTANATSPPESAFFATAAVDEHATVQTQSDGDLWPSCWSNDDNLYAANGDGKGFSLGGTSSDIAVSRIGGGVTNLTGSTVAQGDAVGQVWNPDGQYNRKPTGMVCVNGTLYLAVQDLNTSFNDVPSATIVKSTDHGQTWTWDRSAPMFDNHVFTTVFFADFGKDSADSADGYVYAYGLDNNWRDSFDDSVPDPVDVYLGRVPASSVQNRASWQFYTGTANGSATWSSDISARQAVLHDDRRIYQNIFNADAHNLSVISQGGVLYDKPLGRYIYSSWSEYTYEFYDSPTPWGPWQHFLTKDFGGYPWTQAKNGGYATTIPSKFLSADGRTMYVQSNVCPCGGGGTSVYDFALRKLVLTPATPSTPSNPLSDTTNLARELGTVPIERVAHFGNNTYYNDGNLANSEDDWNNESKSASWWGYTWPRQYTINKVVYTTGGMFSDGGWFSANLRVQVRHGSVWADVTGSSVAPAYPYSSAAGSGTSYTFTFDPASADGVRIVGVPGGAKTFTSIGELAVYYGAAVRDQSFENQTTNAVSPPWAVQGPDGHGIDRGLGLAHSGANNAWIRTSTTNWNAITQLVPVAPNTNYVLTGWIRTSGNLADGYFGVRPGSSTSPFAETHFGIANAYTRLSVAFTSGSNTSVTVFGGYWAPGGDSWLQLDDISLAAA